MKKHRTNGAIILPTLLLLAGITLLIGLSFSFYATTGIQVVTRQLKSQEAFAGAESGIDDAIRRVLKIFFTLSPSGALAAVQIVDGLDNLASYDFTVSYPDGQTRTVDVTTCYNIGGSDTCNGEIASQKIRIRSVGQSDTISRALEAMLSVDLLTYQITVDSIKEIAFVLPIPDAPSDLEASMVSSSRIDLTWTDNSDDETGFSIERSLSEESGFSIIGTTDEDETSYSATGLNPETQYYFQVVAVGTYGNSEYSNVANATTDVAPPTAPSNLAGTVISSSQINLTWVDNSTNEDNFVVERSTDGASYSEIATVGAGVTSHSATGLSATTLYYFRVKATNSNGASAYSSVLQKLTNPTPCAGGSGISDCLVLEWKFDEGSGASAADSVGGYTGTLYSSPSWVVGKSDDALSFGTSAYVGKNTPGTVLNISNTFTISMWIKPTTTYTVYSSFLWPTHGQSWPSGAGVGMSAGSDRICVMEHAAGYMPCSINWAGTISTSEWTHVVIVYSSKVPKLYVDGDLKATGSASPAAAVHPSSGGRDTYYNRGGVGSGANGWNALGGVDEFRIYNRALSDSDVLDLYNSY